MIRYEKYKESGIDWIGAVPVDWEVKKLKHMLLGVYSGEGISNNEMEEDGEYEIYGGNGVMGYTNKYNSDGEIIVIGRVGAKCGVTYLLDKRIWISDNALQTKTSQNYRYLFYLLEAIDFNQYANQNAQPLITGTLVKNFSVPFLKCKDEQFSIAHYLDIQTQKIDQLITNKKVQTEKLKELRQIEINNAVTKGLNPHGEMKDSDIDWLGEIPKHWDVKRLKNVAHVNQSVINEKTDPEYEIKYIDIGNVTSNGQFLEIQEMTFSEAPSRARRKPKHNSIILSTVRTYLRAIAFIENPDENLIASTGFAVIDAFEKLFDASYLYFQMISQIVVERVIANSEGVSYPAISSTKLGDIKIIIPPKTEQEKIASYLKERVSGIDKLIKNVEVQILKLQELRKIKIYEAVTGKIKVNSYAETTA